MEDKKQSLRRSIQYVKREIIGQDQAVELLFVALLANGHVLLESVPGTGKTKLAKTVAAVYGGQFRRVQFTPDVLPSDVTGIQFFNPKKQEFEIRYGPAFTNLLLADEINRAAPKTQSSLLEVMEEQQLTIDGETLPVPVPFTVIATQNPVEQGQGTYPLPEAQLDRFLLRIQLDYPELEDERNILNTYKQVGISNEAILNPETVLQLQQEVNSIHITDDVKDYLLSIIHASRNHPEVRLGASTRAALAWLKAGQAYALLDGRDFVSPQDIKLLAKFILGHRIMLTMEGAIRKTKQEIVEEILANTTVPVESGSQS
ncbi:magnesium chelatase [Terribacillus saccharophilus]|jgi:MoxR-like ATPase|uniref:Magnesium chelatase n=1 Tax=Terribacillus saccharophilus TaxID=361277 RepID=A0A268HA01_9BACI|nr:MULTISPECIES: MoxR family ATPase [Terribacillus]PAD34919.1 magnesium chelatase [Terribacillus saccharophilus]PAD95823.1 magnesium chelatase [Terribacillus saccharophilus]PAD99391.1 magnesium chelatase [Terribacillus saccharophilus]PAE06703.1 magnesium chelatase [Terribacillus saccharophilus]VVM34680.1 FIG022979: MoxR-like ATPases [Terribacillus sp. AE2B 122]